mmetsp:Transcript_43836/g.74536  ORF Transcript_43836/g.74536 Transcript_43836/m.74536 type:complete len:91 (-) Transcript_43836:1282-1554(-)
MMTTPERFAFDLDLRRSGFELGFVLELCANPSSAVEIDRLLDRSDTANTLPVSSIEDVEDDDVLDELVAELAATEILSLLTPSFVSPSSP